MSVKVEQWAWKQKLGSAPRKMLLVRLAQNADDQGWLWIKTSELVKDTELSRSTVIAHLGTLRGLGLVQAVAAFRDDGSQAPSFYRVMVPWADMALGPPLERRETPVVVRPGVGRRGVREPDPLNSPLNSPKEENQKTLGADAPGPENLGQNRWRVVSSREGRGPFVVDLKRGTCTCENRFPTECRHMRVARQAQGQVDTAKRREFRDVVWDELVSLFGPVSPKGEPLRGEYVTEVAELLTAERVGREPAVWGEEIHRRYGRLVDEWGQARVTLRSFVTNFGLAGKLLASNGAGSRGHDEEELELLRGEWRPPGWGDDGAP